MKIALVCNNLSSGGAEKLVHDMAIEIKKRDISVDVILTTRFLGVYDKELREKGINIIYLNKGNKNTIYRFYNIFKLVKILKKYDVVHIHVFPVQLWGSIASFFLPKKIKFITTEHSTNNRRRNIRIFKIIDRIMYSNYNNIVAITHKVEKNLKEWIGNDFKINIIENGIDLKRFSCAKNKEFDFFEDFDKNKEKILIMVSRFVPAKNQNTLINSLNYLPNTRLLLVGEGELIEESKELVNKLNLDKRVKFLGFRKDVPELLKYADLIVQSSNWEGLSLSMIEAMASGTPLIGSKVEGIMDLIEKEELLFENGNEKELAEKAKALLENEELYKSMSGYLKEKSKNYSIEKMVEKYLEIYEE